MLLSALAMASSMSQDDKRVITKMMLESRYTRVNSYREERERRKQELEAKTAALQLDEEKKAAGARVQAAGCQACFRQAGTTCVSGAAT